MFNALPGNLICQSPQCTGFVQTFECKIKDFYQFQFQSRQLQFLFPHSRLSNKQETETSANAGIKVFPGWLVNVTEEECRHKRVLNLVIL